MLGYHAIQVKGKLFNSITIFFGINRNCCREKQKFDGKFGD